MAICGPQDHWRVRTLGVTHDSRLYSELFATLLWWATVSSEVELRLSLVVTTVLGIHSDLTVRLADRASAGLTTPCSWARHYHVPGTCGGVH